MFNDNIDLVKKFTKYCEANNIKTIIKEIDNTINEEFINDLKEIVENDMMLESIRIWKINYYLSLKIDNNGISIKDIIKNYLKDKNIVDEMEGFESE